MNIQAIKYIDVFQVGQCTVKSKIVSWNAKKVMVENFFASSSYLWNLRIISRKASTELFLRKKKPDKTGVINDPLGQTHSLASSEHCFHFVLFCQILKSGNERTDNMYKNNYPYRPWLWVGRVDQCEKP